MSWNGWVCKLANADGVPLHMYEVVIKKTQLL